MPLVQGAAGVCPEAHAGPSLAGSPQPWPAALGPQPTGEVVEELVAEATAEHRQQVAVAGNSLQSPDVPASAAAAFASTKQLKLQLPLPPSSRSPSSSPGIQAVHAHDAAGSSGTPEVAAAAALAGEAGAPSAAPSPDQYRVDACSVEPASLPQSPFAAEAAQGSPLLRNVGRGGGSAVQWRLQSAEAARPGGMPQPDQVQAAAAHGRKQVEEEGHDRQDAYTQFGSYEEMVAQFQQLAAECEDQQEVGEGEGPAEFEQEFTAADADELGQSRNDGTDQFTVTAASSFSGKASA